MEDSIEHEDISLEPKPHSASRDSAAFESADEAHEEESLLNEPPERKPDLCARHRRSQRARRSPWAHRAASSEPASLFPIWMRAAPRPHRHPIVRVQVPRGGAAGQHKRPVAAAPL